MKILKDFTKLFYPKDITCNICDDDLCEENKYLICEKCMPKRLTKFCQLCGIGISGTKNYCGMCISYDRSFDEARAPFCFDNEDIRHMVYGIKYGGRTYSVKTIAEFMIDTYYEQNWQPDYVTYVPVHKKKKLYERGYDQAELIAKYIANEINVPMLDALEKVVYSKKNAAKLGRAERKTLVANSFIVKNPVKGKNILLVDDVFTSGTTAEECARVIKLAKAKRVWVLTFATSKEKVPTYDLRDADKALNKFLSSKLSIENE